MKSIASSAIFTKLFKNYFRVQKTGGFLLNCTQKFHLLFCVGVYNSQQYVYVLQSRRREMKFCI